MRALRSVAFLLVLCSTANSWSADKPFESWLPITQQDWDTTAVPGNPGAAAIQLYFSYYKDDNEKFIFQYQRIKILQQPGLKYADVKISLERDQSLKEVEARTIQPGGRIIDFQGKPLEKVLFKSRGIKSRAEVFTLPEVTVGSIVEYKWVISLPLHRVDPISAWPIQSELYTVKEHLRFRAFQGLVSVPTEWANVAHHSQVSYSYLHHAVEALPPEKKQGNLMELTLENVPAFDAEEYMPPEDDFKTVVLFYYGGRETASPEKFWTEWRRVGTEYEEKFIGNFREVREAALQAIGNETDPEKKLRRLYARAQQVRNLSFERERTAAEKKQENLKTNNYVNEVLQRGYGTGWEIDELFVALARAAGFQASILGVTNRRQRSFNKLVLWLGQIDGAAVLVNVNGKDVVLDPGTTFCPYGLLPWNHTSAPALNFSKTGDEFVTTPVPQSSSMHRVAMANLAADGSLSGEISLELTGEDALEHRLDTLDTDAAGRRKNFEDEVQAWLPNGSVAKMRKSSGWDSSDQPLLATFSIEVPGFASVAGKRLIAPAYFFSTLQKDMFTHDFRRYPIVFPYTFSEADEIVLKLPQGYSVEVPPYRRKVTVSYGAYEISASAANDELVVRRTLHMDVLDFPPESYPDVKDFFAIVQAGDTGQAVLREDSAREQTSH